MPEPKQPSLPEIPEHDQTDTTVDTTTFAPADVTSEDCQGYGGFETSEN